MGAFDRALGRVCEAERDYRRTIGRSIDASLRTTWKIVAFGAKAGVASVFPTVQWVALSWIFLSSSIIAAQAVGALIAAFIITAAGSFWLTLLYEGGAAKSSEQQITKPVESGFWQNLWLLVVQLRGITKFMALYYALWLGGAVVLSYTHHRYLSKLPSNPALELNEQWWRLATEYLPVRFLELRDWIAEEMQRL